MRNLRNVAICACLFLFCAGPLWAKCTLTTLGDVNGDNRYDVADAVYLLAYLHNGGPAPLPCVEAADIYADGIVDQADASAMLCQLFGYQDVPGDANYSGTLDIADAIYIFSYLQGGAAPKPCNGAAEFDGHAGITEMDGRAILCHLFGYAELVGDANGDKTLNIADSIYIYAYVNSGGPEPLPCLMSGDFNGDGQVTALDGDAINCHLFGFGGVPGDANNDGSVDIADLITLSNYLWAGGPEPSPCLLAGDMNCDGKVDIADWIYLNDYLNNGGPAPC